MDHVLFSETWHPTCWNKFTGSYHRFGRGTEVKVEIEGNITAQRGSY